ncbi:MAG: CARDB domain-containing protein [Myxococcaceae bacterium]
MKHLAAAVLLVCALGGGDALAQVYTVMSQPQPYVPLTGATAVSLTGSSFDPSDEGSATISLGFNFPYYGQTITQVGIDSNGLILLGTTAIDYCARTSSTGYVCYSGGKVPSTTRSPHSFIAPWWADMDGQLSGVIQYTRPNASEIVIEYAGWAYYSYSATATYSFQIRLNASGMIQVHYGSISGTSTSNTSAGFENETGTQGAALLACSAAAANCLPADWPTNTLFTIGQPVAADLAVPTVSLSNMDNDAGSDTLSFTVSPTFRNFGQTDAGSFYWNAFLSTDRSLQADGGSSDGGYGDKLIYSSTAPLGCKGLSTTTDSASLAISPRPPPGQYYVLVEADTTKAVSEASEANNVGSTASYFTQGLDLVATSVSGPASSGPGNTISVNAKWFNQGTDPVGPTGFKIYLSSTTAPHPLTDFVLYSGSKDITGGQTVDENLSIQVPQNVPGGEFYYVLGIDPELAVAEAQEGNNLAVSSTKVNMQQSDLIIDSVEFVDPVTDAPIRTGYFGQQARMRVTMHNAGGADCANFHVGVAVSTDANLSLLSDTIAHDEPVAMLAQGAAATVAFNFNLPLKDRLFRNFPSGNYYLFAMLDSFGACTELSKNNNNLIVAGAANLRAPSQDYAVTRVDAPASAAVGEVAPLFRSIKNVGNVDGTQVSYRYFASANPIITVQDIPLGIVGPNGALSDSGSVTLGIGSEDPRTEFVKLPASMPPGVYYLGCIVDPGALVAELEESNNAMASVSTVQVAAPSLRIATTQLPDGTTDRPYNFRLVALGEQGPSTWIVDTATGDLPPGLSLATDGLLSGTPTNATVAAFTVLLTSVGNRQATVRLVLRVLPPTSELEITTRALPPVVNSQQIPYQGAIGAAGGVKPYTWRLAAGTTLPNGIRLSSEGIFAGAAAAGVVVGETNVTFEVQDSVGSRARADLKMRVVVPGALLVKNLTVPDSLVNYDYLTDLAAVNADGTALAMPLSWSVASGALPDGLHLSTQGGERGIIQGKPLVAGTFAFSIQVEDSKGRADAADFILRVFPNRFKVSASSIPTGLHPGDTVDFTLTSSGSNIASTRFSLYAGLLPPGLTISEQGQVAGTIAAEASVGVYNFVAQAKDGAGGSGLGAFTLEVSAVSRTAGCSAVPGTGGFLALLGLVPLWLAARRRRAAASAVALLAALVLPLSAQAQPVTYQLDGPNPAVGYVTLTGGDLTGISTYTGQGAGIPFDFKYFGQTYSTVTVTQHGYLVFVGDDGTTANMGIPNTNTSTYYPISFVAPWWDYLYKSTGSYIRSQTVGTAPNRRTVIEWKVSASSTGPLFTFEVQIFESTNQIRFLYGPTAPSTGTATVGMQKTTSSGIAAMTCTTASSGACGTGNFPVNQMFDFLLPPDLTVGEVSGEATAYAGVAFTSTAMLKNRGGRTAGGANVRFYLGTAPAFDAGYPSLGDSTPIDLAAGGQQLVSASAPIPPGTAPGDYFLHAMADPNGGMAESDEGNNTSVPLVVKVGAPTPDLVASGISGPLQATAGQTLTIARTLKNNGNADMTAPVKYTWFVSNNEVVSYSDVPVSPSSSLGILAAGATETNPDQVTLPSTLAAGKYWLGVCVDYDPSGTPVSTANEISEVNNCATAATGFILNTGALAIVTTTLPGAAQFSPYGLRLQATGGDGQYAWTLPAGQLPAGLALNPSGDLTGTPSVAGTFSFDAKVASGGAEVTASFTLAVTGANLPLTIVPQELPVAEFSRTYLANLVAIGGKPPYVWTIKAESRLPVGLALATDGHLEGRATDAGEFPFSVDLTDSAGTKVSADLRIRVVTPSSMHIATTRLMTGYLKKEYLQPLQAVGGRAPYAWSVVKFQQLALNPTDQPGKAETAIPDGYGIKVEQDPSGQYVLRGAPNRAGLAALTLRVQDANGAEDITTLPLTISYEEALAITTVALPDAFVSHSYIAKLSHNGGAQVQGIQYSVPCVMQVGADLEAYGCAASDPMQTTPPGLLLGADGQVTGTPLALPASKDGTVSAVTYSFLVKVTDSQGREDVRGLSIRVHPDYVEEKSGCSGAPLAPSLGALLAAALLALRVRRRR